MPGSITGGSGSLTVSQTQKLAGIESGVWLIHDDGTSELYKPSADTNSARGTALASAMTAATSTDTVQVGPGTHTGQVQLKLGVTLFLQAGATIDYTGSGATFLEPASSGELYILGNGTLKKSGADLTAQHVFNITKAATELYVEAAEIECEPDVLSTDSSAFSTIKVTDGYFKVRCGELKGIGCSVLHRVTGGEVELIFDHFEASGAGVKGAYIGTAANYGRVWFNGIVMKSDPAAQLIHGEGDFAQSVDVYVNCAALFGCLDFQPASGLFEIYLNAQLLTPFRFAGDDSSSAGRPVLLMGGSGILVGFITLLYASVVGDDPCVKITNLYPGSVVNIGLIYCDAGLALEFGDSGGTATGLVCAKLVQTLNNSFELIRWTAGGYTLQGSRMITGSSTIPIRIYAGTPIIEGCIFPNAGGSIASIAATSNVVAMNSWAKVAPTATTAAKETATFDFSSLNSEQLNGNSVILTRLDGTTDYLWFVYDGGSPAPATDPLVGDHGHEVDVLEADADTDLAEKFKVVAHALADFNATRSGTVVTVTAVTNGIRADATDNAGLGANTTLQGAYGPVTVTVAGGLTVDSNIA